MLGEEEANGNRGNGTGCSPGGKLKCQVLCLEVSLSLSLSLSVSLSLSLSLPLSVSLMQVGILGEVSEEESAEYSSVFQVCPFRDWSPLTGQCQAGSGSSLQLVLVLPTWSCCFLGLELKYSCGLDVISREVTFCMRL